MKTTTATALSLFGVIVAGSAAAMVNTTIFDTAPTEAAASEVIIPEAPMIDLTIPNPSPASRVTDVVGMTTVPAATSVSASTVTSSNGATNVSAQVVTSESTVTPTTTTAPSASAPTTAAPTTTTAPSTTRPPTTTTPPKSTLVAYNVGQAGVVTLDVIDGRLTVVDAAPAAGWTVAASSRDAVRNEILVTFRSATLEADFIASFASGSIVADVDSRAVGGSTAYDDDHDDHDDDDHDDDDHDDDDHHDDDHDDD
jgi:hypothetical protein